MARRRTTWQWALAHLLLAGVGLAGCNRAPADPSGDPEPNPGPAAVKSKSKSDEPKRPAVTVDPRLKQPFAEATRSDPPAEFHRPPDLTMTKKNTGKLCAEVNRLWNTIAFTDEDGKPLNYRATIETKLGVIEMQLRPDWAPNHVRNFVALARAGYYDGLVFERTVHQVSQVEPKVELQLIEAGCPLGTGEPGYGSIGYWLKPEFNAKAPHEEGAVGACHGMEADTAACRFYITLNKAPFLDGNYTVFGKVTRGLDIVRTIFTQPAKEEEQDPEGYQRPVNPVVIDKVTIHVSP